MTGQNDCEKMTPILEGVFAPARMHTLQQWYNSAWTEQGQREDSPALGRFMMARTVLGAIREAHELRGTCNVLDVGSGPRPVEVVMQRIAKRCLGRTIIQDVQAGSTNIVSCDLGSIDPRLFRPTALLGRQHATASSPALPFRSGVFDVAFANMSFDMVGVESATYQQSLCEIGRVLRGDGIFFANLHHAELYEDLTERFQDGVTSDVVTDYFTPNVENPFFSSKEQIEHVFGQSPLLVKEIALRREGQDRWWEVVALPT